MQNSGCSVCNASHETVLLEAAFENEILLPCSLVKMIPVFDFFNKHILTKLKCFKPNSVNYGQAKEFGISVK